MKKFLLVAVATLALVSCRSNWEYQTIVDEGEAFAYIGSKSFTIDDSRLNELGAQGWELVDVYTLTETVHPNFGNSAYVTGLQPNVRTEKIAYIFKRKK